MTDALNFGFLASRWQPPSTLAERLRRLGLIFCAVILLAVLFGYVTNALDSISSPPSGAEIDWDQSTMWH